MRKMTSIYQKKFISKLFIFLLVINFILVETPLVDQVYANDISIKESLASETLNSANEEQNKSNLVSTTMEGGMEGYQYKSIFSIDHTKIDSQLKDFPATIYLNDNNFDFSRIKGDCSDICFTDTNLNPLKFEKEGFEPITYSTNLCKGGTPISSGDDAPKNNAFDGDSSTYWESNWCKYYRNAYIGYDFGESKNIRKIIYKGGSGSSSNPYAVVVQNSQDAVNWNTVTILDTDDTIRSAKTFNIPESTGGRYWRLLCNESPDSWEVAEIQMMEATSQSAVYNVLLPSVSTTTDTTFYMWYGNANAQNKSIESWQDQTGIPLEYKGGIKLLQGVIPGKRVASFNGSGSCLEFPNNPNFSFGNSDFTIETSIYVTRGISGAEIFRLNNMGSFEVAPIGLNYYDTNGLQLLTSYDGTSWSINKTVSNVLSSNAWNHIAIVRKGGTISVYVNGSPVLSAEVSTNSLFGGVTSDNTVSYIGQHSSSTGNTMYLNGFRVTKGQARYLGAYTPPSSYVIDNSNVVFCTNFDTIYDSDYMMVQHMGNSLVDATGNGNNGTAIGTTVVDTEYGKARSFNGLSDYIQIPDSSDFNFRKWFTNILALAKFDTLVSQAIVGQDPGSSPSWRFGTSEKGKLQVSYRGSSISQNSSITPPLSRFTCFGFNLDYYNEGIEFYADNDSQVCGNYPVLENSNVPLRIGATSDPDNPMYFSGTISELRISNSYTERSDAWLKAESHSLKNQLLSYGDDHGNTFDTATQTSVTNGALKVSGLINNIADIDMFSFTADQTKSLPVKIITGNNNIVATLYNADRSKIQEIKNGSSISLTQGQRYYVEIKSNSAQSSFSETSYFVQIGTESEINNELKTKAEAGINYSTVLKPDGTVWAWGKNDKGQCGNGKAEPFTTFTQVLGLTDVKDISVGYFHNLALKKDGTVWAWGGNSNGQLGNGTTANKTIAVQVSGLTDVIAIAAGGSHSLAIKKDGTVFAWGGNFEGQLGDGTGEDTSTPVQSASLTNIIAIAAGGNHSLALKSDGTVFGWGYNDDRQTGNGPLSMRRIPGKIENFDNVSAIAAGGNHSLALKRDGTVWAWGNNYEGQIGTETNGRRVESPVQVNSLKDVSTISAGYAHSMALKRDGSVWAWGNNQKGQLGDNSTVNKSAPVLVNNLGAMQRIDAGYNHSLTVGEEGSLWLFGQKSLVPVEYWSGYGDDHGNTADTATQTSVTNDALKVSGLINNIADIDMFCFTANQTKSLQAKIITGNNTNIIATLYDADMTKIQEIENGSSISLTQGQRYYVEIKYNGAQSSFSETSYLVQIGTESGLNNAFDCVLGKSIYIPFHVNNANNLNNKVFILRYNASDLDVVDLVSQTKELETKAGTVTGSNIEILSCTPGLITFKINKSIPDGKLWSGVINIFKFKAKITGTTSVATEYN